MLLRAILQLLIDSIEVRLGTKQQLLLVRIDVKLEEVIAHQGVNQLFVALNLILDPHDLAVPGLVQFSPHSLDLGDPGLVRMVRRLLRPLTLNRH